MEIAQLMDANRPFAAVLILATEGSIGDWIGVAFDIPRFRRKLNFHFTAEEGIC